MLTLSALLLLAQVVVTPPAAPVAPTWGPAVTWTQQGRVKRAWVSPVLVAEPSPGDAGATAVREVDPGAEPVVQAPRMRLWRVRDAAAVRARVPALLPVLHELPSTAGRLLVPVGVVCGGQALPVSGLPALERVSAQPGCLPNFWMKAVPK